MERPDPHYDAALLKPCREWCDAEGLTEENVLIVLEQCLAAAEDCAKRHNGLVRAILGGSVP